MIRAAWRLFALRLLWWRGHAAGWLLDPLMWLDRRTGYRAQWLWWWILPWCGVTYAGTFAELVRLDAEWRRKQK